MYVIRKELETSLPMIGELFGGRDHTTVIHAVDKVQNLSKEKDSLKYEFVPPIILEAVFSPELKFFFLHITFINKLVTLLN